MSPIRWPHDIKQDSAWSPHLGVSQIEPDRWLPELLQWGSHSAEGRGQTLSRCPLHTSSHRKECYESCFNPCTGPSVNPSPERTPSHSYALTVYSLHGTITP